MLWRPRALFVCYGGAAILVGIDFGPHVYDRLTERSVAKGIPVSLMFAMAALR